MRCYTSIHRTLQHLGILKCVFHLLRQVVAEALRDYGLPEPSTCHMDWFAGSLTAARRVWPNVKTRRGVEHCRRNVIKNDRQGKRKPLSSTKKKSSAKKLRARAPHLTSRSIFAWLRLQSALVFMTTRTMSHLADPRL